MKDVPVLVREVTVHFRDPVPENGGRHPAVLVPVVVKAELLENFHVFRQPSRPLRLANHDGRQLFRPRGVDGQPDGHSGGVPLLVGRPRDVGQHPRRVLGKVQTGLVHGEHVVGTGLHVRLQHVKELQQAAGGEGKRVVVPTLRQRTDPVSQLEVRLPSRGEGERIVHLQVKVKVKVKAKVEVKF